MLKTAVVAIGAITIAAISIPGAVAAQKADKSAAKLCAEIKAVDDDTDGELDLAEAKAAAERRFKQINKDGDKTLEGKELKGRITKAEMKTFNLDKDKSIELPEWLAITEARFKAANPDGDQTLECKELKTAKGKSFLKMVR
ncbi:MAG: EF-hand domain-containing protein [Hyphomicrobiaceae bacterium]|nr:EF-hand domain-containing protein [Hyphomicrobiaceae bacterium]